MKTLHIAGANVELYDDGLTVSEYRGRARIDAMPQEDQTYVERAHALGYGTDLTRMSREHELTHHMLADWLGLPYSPTMMGLASVTPFKDWGIEENAVLAIQGFANSVRVSLQDLALRRYILR